MAARYAGIFEDRLVIGGAADGEAAAPEEATAGFLAVPYMQNAAGSYL
ncbi:MAG: hypothetical protein Q7T33_01435 [Dehalococcoidia bacterium]|nr:hypothetical protein [Dehalococcoidia bacterium]